MQIHVHIKFPEPTKLGLKFLKSKGEEPYPEADIYAALNGQVPILFKFHILVSLNELIEVYMYY